MRFTEQIVLITGGGSGIGREMAVQFAAEGASLVIADRYLDAAQGTVDLITAPAEPRLPRETDVSQSDQVEAMAEAALNDSARSMSWSTMPAFQSATRSSISMRRPGT